MNLFSARLRGELQTTEKFEQTMEVMRQNIERYRKVEQSQELAEYYALQKVVTATAFKNKRQQLVNTKYSDTEEGRKTARYKALSGSMRILGYLRAIEMQNFKDFLAFRESEEYSKLRSAKERLKSQRLRIFYAIDRSAFYQNYLKVLHSQELKEYLALQQELSTDDFKQRDAFWKNPNRWQTTEEYKQEQRFEQLAKSDDIQFFLAQKAEDIQRAEMFKLVFADDMLNSANWKPGFGFDPQHLRDGYSLSNEHQAYNNGKNTIFAENRMSLETRQETTTALAWDEKKGFVEQVFSYTSDVMNTKQAFAQQEGLFMAKVRSQGVGHHLFALSTGKPQAPIAALYYFDGKNAKVGVFSGQKGQVSQAITGMLRSQYFIYSLRWTKDELIWYVNNLEIYRCPNTLPKEKMFLLAQSFFPKTESAGVGKLKVSWVKVFVA